MTKLTLLAIAAVVPVASAFAPVAPATSIAVSNKPAFVPFVLFAEEEGKASEAVFIADEGEVNEDAAFAKAESLGRGAAKVSNAHLSVKWKHSENRNK